MVDLREVLFAAMEGRIGKVQILDQNVRGAVLGSEPVARKQRHVFDCKWTGEADRSLHGVVVAIVAVAPNPIGKGAVVLNDHCKGPRGAVALRTHLFGMHIGHRTLGLRRLEETVRVRRPPAPPVKE